MRKYLLPENGTYYKANLHCHTTVSDGETTPEETKAGYVAHGYSVVAFTDHDVLIGHGDLCDDNFVALNAFELELMPPYFRGCGPRKACHICYIALEPDNLIMPMWNRTGKYFFCQGQRNNAPLVKFDENEPDYERVYSVEGISEMMQIGRDKGFFVTYNHPVWSGETYEQYGYYRGMHAMEMCNFGCYNGGFDEYNGKIYDDILRTGNRIFAIAGDDNHSLNSYEAFGAYTMIKADKLDYRTITKALEDGNFYTSLGPEIYDLYVEDDMVHITCSPAKKIALNVGQFRRANRKLAPEGGFITEAAFKIDTEWDGYFRLTVYDEQGRMASTNAYFCDQVFTKEE